MPVSAELGPLAVRHRASRDGRTRRSARPPPSSARASSPRPRSCPGPAPLALVTTSARSCRVDTTTIGAPATGAGPPPVPPAPGPPSRTPDAPWSPTNARPRLRPPTPVPDPALRSCSTRTPPAPAGPATGSSSDPAVLAVAAAIGVARARRAAIDTAQLSGRGTRRAGGGRGPQPHRHLRLGGDRGPGEERHRAPRRRHQDRPGLGGPGRGRALHALRVRRTGPVGAAAARRPARRGGHAEPWPTLQLKLSVAGQQPSETIPGRHHPRRSPSPASRCPSGPWSTRAAPSTPSSPAGPAPRTIPALAGLPPAQAEQALKALGARAGPRRGRLRRRRGRGPGGGEQPARRAPPCRATRPSPIRSRRARTS